MFETLGAMYLSAVKDLYNGFIVAHRMSTNPTSRLVVDAYIHFYNYERIQQKQS